MRFPSRVHSRAFLAIALCVAASPALVTASPEWTGPGFSFVSEKSVDGVAQIDVTYKSGGSSVKGMLFMANATGKRPAVLFAHDGEHGLSADLKSRCSELAHMGYVVFAPDYASKPGNLGKATPADGAVQQVTDAAKILAKHPNVHENRVGIVGTSHGGYVAVQAAIQNREMFSCLVTSSSAIDVAKMSSVKVPMLMQQGDKDQVALMKDARHLNHEIKSHGGFSELKEYTLLGHGFWFYDEADNQRSEVLAQAAWAWEDFTDYLDKKLSKGLSGVASK